MWGRKISYDYLGRRGSDFAWTDPPLDINGNIVEIAQSISDETDLVLITDFNSYSAAEDVYSQANHPASVPDALTQRDGLNVGHLDGSVIWIPERETVARYQWRPNRWRKF